MAMGFESTFRSTFDFGPSVSNREGPPRGIVLHWTGGLGPPEKTFAVLKQRGLSVHYVIGVDGRTEQFASASLVCWHAGRRANSWTLGIEVCCPGFPGELSQKERARGVNRAQYPDTINGRELWHCDYTAEQQAAVDLLVEELCSRHSIPRRVPTDEKGQLLTRTMSARELKAYSVEGGVLGHYHVSSGKRDPGTAPLERLQKRWAR
jgi:hypothetical protein